MYPNSIDPFFIEDNGSKYLFWGSYSDAPTQGTYGVKMSDDGKSIPDLTKKIKIAAGDFEAVMIHKRDDYYYFLRIKGKLLRRCKKQIQCSCWKSRKIFLDLIWIKKVKICASEVQGLY